MITAEPPTSPATEFAPAELLVTRSVVKKGAPTDRLAPRTLPSSTDDTGYRLWKWSRQASTPKFAQVEVLALGLFLIAGLVATAACFMELSRVVDTDAVGHLAIKVMHSRR